MSAKVFKGFGAALVTVMIAVLVEAAVSGGALAFGLSVLDTLILSIVGVTLMVAGDTVNSR